MTRQPGSHKVSIRKSFAAVLLTAVVGAAAVATAPPVVPSVAAATARTFVVTETKRADGTTAHQAWTGTPTIYAYGTPDLLVVNAGLMGVYIGSADGAPLAVGTYTGATNVGAGGTPRLSVSGSPAGDCIALSSFEILQAPTIVDGIVTAFAATFERQCPEAGSVVYGTIAIATDLVLGGLGTSVEFLEFEDMGVIAEASEPLSFQVSNVGSVPVTIGTVAVQGTNAGSYLVSDDCAALAAGDSCTIQVRLRALQHDWVQAAIRIENDLDVLTRVIPVQGQAMYVEGANVSLATATVIGSLPFVDGKQIPLSGTTGQSCPDAAATLWYRYTSSTRRVVFLDTRTSRSRTVLGVYSGAPSPTTRLACGASSPDDVRQTLTFTAEAGVTYNIAVSGSGFNTPYGVVLQASSAPPDTVVLASAFARQYSTFYPYRDGYLDTLRISGMRGEKASVRVVVYDAANKAVRGWDVPAGVGAYAVTWDGKRASGTVLPAGKYRIVQTVTDLWANKLSHTSYVYTSNKRIYTYTYTSTRDAGAYSGIGKTGTGTYSRTASAYAGGLRLSSGSNGAASAAYTFSLPSATIYKSVKFQVLGTGVMNGSVLGLQDWTDCTSFNDGCVYPWREGPLGYAWATVPGAASKNVSSGRAVRGYLHVPGFGLKGVLDARDVRLTVTYGILK